jgi:hypothetical protein
MRVLAVLLAGCLCATGCGGCVDEGSTPPSPSEPAQTTHASPVTSFRPMPLPLRGINLVLRDAGGAGAD